MKEVNFPLQGKCGGREITGKTKEGGGKEKRRYRGK